LSQRNAVNGFGPPHRSQLAQIIIANPPCPFTGHLKLRLAATPRNSWPSYRGPEVGVKCLLPI
jgi:hypothetical protein